MLDTREHRKDEVKEPQYYDEGSEESSNYRNALKALGSLIQDERLPGFPFSEAWPRRYSGRTYELILMSGEIVSNAKVNDLREWMSEGLEWSTVHGNKTQSVVAGWRRTT